jgi:hypothetical protein
MRSSSTAKNAIRRKEPEWTLTNRWPAPQGQSIGFRWRLDQREIFALLILERSTAVAISLFQRDKLAREIKGPKPETKFDSSFGIKIETYKGTDRL